MNRARCVLNVVIVKKYFEIRFLSRELSKHATLCICGYSYKVVYLLRVIGYIDIYCCEDNKREGVYMINRYRLGNNELIIVFKNGKHHVKESHMHYDIVFSGQLETCVEYCERREVGYIVSIVG